MSSLRTNSHTAQASTSHDRRARSKLRGAMNRTNFTRMKLSEILHGKPPTASPHETAASAWDRMQAVHADHLIVLREGEPVGVLSRPDLGGPFGGTHRRMGRRVADLMRRDFITASPRTEVRRAAMLMRRHGVGCLPVLERGRVVGIVTVSDLLRLLERS